MTDQPRIDKIFRSPLALIEDAALGIQANTEGHPTLAGSFTRHVLGLSLLSQLSGDGTTPEVLRYASAELACREQYPYDPKAAEAIRNDTTLWEKVSAAQDLIGLGE